MYCVNKVIFNKTLKFSNFSMCEFWLCVAQALLPIVVYIK